MKIVLFYHSLLSDWNHGNAHFLRGVARELKRRGHEVKVFEPEDSWSVAHLRAEYGDEPIAEFYRMYPELDSIRYRAADLDWARVLADADLVIAHEWNEREVIRRLGELRCAGLRYRLLFHDTHHKSVTEPESLAACDFSGYDGVLAYGKSIAAAYLQRRWMKRAWVWHEAADTRLFAPVQSDAKDGDLVWIGNWGDEERTAELHEFLLEPVKALKLKARIYGVRYPAAALRALADADIEYGGWLANYKVPEIFARYRVTVHVPRRPYVEALPGIPTIRPFEALACGIPLISSPWNDSDGLFTAGEDYLVARDREEMTRQLRAVLENRALAQSLAHNGRRTVLERHTCARRVDQLLQIVRELEGGPHKSNRKAPSMAEEA